MLHSYIQPTYVKESRTWQSWEAFSDWRLAIIGYDISCIQWATGICPIDLM